jgi:hypothetical protein
MRVRAPAGSSAASTKLPLSGSLAGSSGLLITMPASRPVVRYSLTRVSFACVRPVGLSIDHAIETFAGAAPEFDTRYRRIATGRPESSGACGMNGENASSETRTGRVESVKSMRASGNSPVNFAERAA